MLRGVILVGIPILLAACATPRGGNPAVLQESSNPAWSFNALPSEMVVAISPAGKTLRWGGSIGMIIGTGIDAAQNARYRDQLASALEDYDPTSHFQETVETALRKRLHEDLIEVAPLVSTAGYTTQEQAEQDRLKGVVRKGADTLLDLEAMYGLFGPDVLVAARLKGDLYTMPDGTRVWHNDIVVTPEPILAQNKLTDPAKRLSLLPSMNPQLKPDTGVLDQLTENGGSELRRQLDQSFHACTQALLCDLDLVENATGEYYLGKLALYREQFEKAIGHFEKVLALDSAHVEAQNGLAVARGHQGHADQAIEIVREVIKEHPDHGPSNLNLAWWYAVERNEIAEARPHYEVAVTQGMRADKQLQALMESGEGN